MSDEIIEKGEGQPPALADSSASVFGGSGFEQTTLDSFRIPMMKIVQSTSEVMKKSNAAAYNPDAEVGMFWNETTGEIFYKLRLRILAVNHTLVVWGSEGNLVSVHRKTEEHSVVKNQVGYKKYTANGDEVVDTIVLTCVDSEKTGRESVFFMSFSKTSLKHVRSWLTKMMTMRLNPQTMELDPNGKGNLASWAVEWELETQVQSNKKGEWYSIGGGYTPVHGLENVPKESIPLLGQLTKQVLTVDLGLEGQQPEEDILQY